MNVIARLEYELAYYDSAVHHFNHYTKRTPPPLSMRSHHGVIAKVLNSGLTLIFRLIHLGKVLNPFKPSNCELNNINAVLLQGWLFQYPTKFNMPLNKCNILTFEPGQKCHSKVMHRKEVTYSNGSYERKSRGRKLADEMGRAKKFPCTLIDWCTGREWSVNCMTVISAW